MLTTPEGVEVILTDGLVGLVGEAVSLIKDWMALTVSSALLLAAASGVLMTSVEAKGTAGDFFAVTMLEDVMTNDLRLEPAAATSITIPLEKLRLAGDEPADLGVPRNGGPILMGMGVFFTPPAGRRSNILTSI